VQAQAARREQKAESRHQKSEIPPRDSRFRFLVSSGWLVRVPFICLLAAVYLPTLRYGFVWDDEQLVTANPRLVTGKPLEFFGQDFMPALHGASPVRYYRPLSVLSLWLDRQVWGLNPFGFHLTNVLLNAVVLALLGLALSTSFKPQAASLQSEIQNPEPKIASGLVLLGVALFGLHPAHVESVAFVSGRTDVLAAIFVLLSILALLRFRTTGRWYWLGCSSAAFLAALASKESVVLLPVLFLGAWDTMSRRLGTRNKSMSRVAGYVPRPVPQRRTGASFAGLAATAGAFVAVRTLVIGSPLLPAQEPGPWLMLVLNAVGRYVQLTIFPFAHRLVYADQSAFAAFGWPTVVGALALAGLVFLAMRFRHGLVGFGAAWFLVFLLPAANLFLTGASFLSERFLYLPLAGVVFGVSGFWFLVSDFRSIRILRLCALGVLGVIFAAFAAGTLLRMPVWQNQGTLFRTMVREAPESAEAHNNLGGYSFKTEKNYPAAEAEFRRALELRPGLVTAHNNLGDALRKRGEVAGAEEEYRAAIALDPDYAEAQGNLGIVMALTGRPDSAFDRFVRARALNPNLAPAHINIGTAFMQRGELDSALVSFWTAVRLEPSRPESYLNLSRLYSSLGKPDSAALMDRRFRQFSGRRP